jgi:hypothetical protein
VHLRAEVPYLHPPLWVELRVFVLIAFVGIAAVVVGLAVAPGGNLNPYRVQVTELIWTSDGQVLSKGPGFNAAPGGHYSLVLEVENGGFGSIAFANATVVPPFSETSAYLPVAAAFSDANVTVNVTAPNASFGGPLSVNLSP